MKKKTFDIRHTEQPPCHPELAPAHWRACEPYGAGSSQRVSGSDKQRILVSVETSSTHFFLFGSNLAVQKERDSRFSSINPVISAAWMRKSSLHSKPATGSFSTESFQRKNKRRLLAAWQICFANLFARFAFALARNGGCVKGDRRCGFTLAEVLITLAIIGVVAALTIPAVVKNYRETALKTQFKKAYSIVSNTQQKIMFNLGYVPVCYYKEGMGSSLRTECGAYWEEFKNTAKIAKVCRGNALQKGCIAKYKVAPPAGCSHFNPEYLETSSTVYILPDGMIIIPFIENGDTDFLIDINGIKGPNKGGHDLFSFATFYNETSHKSYIKKSPCSGLSVDGGRTTDEMLKWVYQ